MEKNIISLILIGLFSIANPAFAIEANVDNPDKWGIQDYSQPEDEYSQEEEQLWKKKEETIEKEYETPQYPELIPETVPQGENEYIPNTESENEYIFENEDDTGFEDPFAE